MQLNSLFSSIFIVFMRIKKTKLMSIQQLTISSILYFLRYKLCPFFIATLRGTGRHTDSGKLFLFITDYEELGARGERMRKVLGYTHTVENLRRTEEQKLFACNNFIHQSFHFLQTCSCNLQCILFPICFIK